MKLTVETREVLAACYLGPNKQNCRMLSHAALVDGDGCVAQVLCRRVSEMSLADRNASDPKAAPTCEHCQRALRKRAKGEAGRPS